MKNESIQIPHVDAEQNVEIEIEINGKNKRLYYRVETSDCEFEDEETEERVKYLKKVIKQHDPD
jgi:hypothetical protein